MAENTTSLQVFNYADFKVRTLNDNGEIWVVARDIAQALEYNIDGGLKKYFAHVPEIWKDGKRISTPGGPQNMLCLTEQGLYFFLGRSDKRNALPFQMWIAGEVIPSIRKDGYYIHPAKQQQFDADLDMRRKDLDLRGAQILQSLIDKELFPLTPETRTVFAHEVFRLVTGHNYLAMLPEATEKWFTATDIGKELGISANMVGRIAKKEGIKPPEGESNEFGRWIFSKSQYSSREVPSFIYNEYALDWFKNHFTQSA